MKTLLFFGGFCCFISKFSQLQNNVDDYIIVLKDNIELNFQSLSEENTSHSLFSILRRDKHFNIKQNYQLLNGFLATISNETYKTISNHSFIKHLEKDFVYDTNSVQTNTTWGLARLISKESLLNDTINYTYRFDEDSGEGVNVYVIDTGINIDHEEFEGRAVAYKDLSNSGNNLDTLGHGTHVAGIIAGKTFGVCKKAKLISIKVTDYGFFFKSSLILSLEAVIEHARNERGVKGSVINMSVGGSYSLVLDLAVDRAAKEGFIIVTAAGNKPKNACEISPASSKNVITVGATDINDNIATYSNYGECVDIFAPGTSILSSWIGSKDKTNTKSGTSMAAPFVTGLVAYIMSRSSERFNKEQILDKIIEHSNKGYIKNLPIETPNALAYNYLAPN